MGRKYFFKFQAGSVVVRVRRDADEQRVLAHVTDKLTNVVSKLTIQVTKVRIIMNFVLNFE